MKANLILIPLLFAVGLAKGQDICTPGVFSVKRMYQNDTLISNCDTVFYMGKHTFQVYHNLYDAARNNDVRRLADAYERARSMYEARIEEQSREYHALQQEFDQIYARSRDFVAAGMAANDSIRTSIGLANTSLDKANNTIERLNEAIKNERWNSTKTKLAIGGGAGLLGLLVGLLVN